MKLTVLVFGIILATAFSLSRIYNKPKEKEVLGLISPEVIITPEISPTEATTLSAILFALPSATPTASASAVLKPTPTSQPTPTPTPSIAPATSQEINGYIDRYSAQYGVDPNVIRHIAVCESGFNPNATNYIYAGLFQFNSTTWTNIREQMGEPSSPDLRFSAEASVQTAAYALSIGKGKMWPNCLP